MPANLNYHLVIETSLPEDLEHVSEVAEVWKQLLPQNSSYRLDQVHVIKEGSLKKSGLELSGLVLMVHQQKTPQLSLNLFLFQIFHSQNTSKSYLGFTVTKDLSDQCFFPVTNSRKFTPVKASERTGYADALVWAYLFFGPIDQALKPISQRFEAAEYVYHAGHLDHPVRGALFLDRDGVLIEDGKYLFEPEQVVLKEGVVELIKRAREKNYFVFCLTNQSGVARGYFTEKQMHQCHQKVTELLASQGQKIDAWYFCPFHKDGEVADYKKHSLLRKPYSGMLLQAVSDHPVDLAGSLMVGDNLSDQLDLVGLTVYLTPGHYPLKGAVSKIVNHFSEIQF